MKPPTTAEPDTHLRFTAIFRHFGRVKVLAGVSGEAEPGEILLVRGSNGSGKSTLLRCLAGLLAPEAGQIDYSENGSVLDTAERRRRIGYVAPDLAFYEELSTLENLIFFARLKRVPAERGAELLDRVGLPHDRAAGALSSGMRQRLRWAFALLGRPRLLLLDEPFQNLDAPGEELGRELLVEHLEQGLAVVASPTHLDLPHVARTLDLGG